MSNIFIFSNVKLNSYSLHFKWENYKNPQDLLQRTWSLKCQWKLIEMVWFLTVVRQKHLVSALPHLKNIKKKKPSRSWSSETMNVENSFANSIETFWNRVQESFFFLKCSTLEEASNINTTCACRAYRGCNPSSAIFVIKCNREAIREKIRCLRISDHFWALE